MIQVKVAGTYYLPVRLLDSSGDPVTGKVYSDVTATAYYNDNTNASVSPAASHFPEYSGGAYGLKIDSIANKPGPMVVVVVVSGANDFVGVYDIVADLASDAVSEASTAATAAAAAETAADAASTAATAASTAAAAAQSSSATAAAQATIAATAAGGANTGVAALTDVFLGRWKLDTSLNQLILYGEDNTTEVARFNTFDNAGNPSTATIYERTKV